MWRWLVVLAACGSSEPVVSAGSNTLAATAPGDGGVAIPDAGAFTLPLAWTACEANAECTIVSLGCCDETPVRRDHAFELRTLLERSGRAYCPPKAACGPSKHGTWDGEPAVCRGGVCRMPGGL